MAKYKSEFLYQSYRVKGIPLRSYMVSVMNDFQRIGSIFPWLYNFFVSNRLISSVLKLILNFSQNRRIPLLSRQTLRSWYRKYSREQNGKVF